jgi:hypothetical protein
MALPPQIKLLNCRRKINYIFLPSALLVAKFVDKIIKVGLAASPEGLDRSGFRDIAVEFSTEDSLSGAKPGKKSYFPSISCTES